VRVLRLAAVLVFILLPVATHATTSESISDRLRINGDLSDIAADEWVLDAGTSFPEDSDDSRWGSDRDLARVAVTWDHAFLYLAVDFRTRGESVMLLIESGPGGLRSLDGAGDFRRLLDVPGLSPTVLLLATPGSQPRVARVDAAHPFQLVDRATAPAVLNARVDGTAALEVAIPWSLLNLDEPSVRLVAVLTRETGTGAGDAAPDAQAPLPPDASRRALLDRVLAIRIDGDGDGVADAGVAPVARTEVRTAATVAAYPEGADLNASVTPGVIAPDRGDEARFRLSAGSALLTDTRGTCTIWSVDGRRVRELAVSVPGSVSEASVTWDGRDDAGNVVPGGVYVARIDVETTTAGGRRRERVNVGVAVAR